MPHIATTRTAAVQEIIERPNHHRTYKLGSLNEIAGNIAAESTDDDTAALAAIVAYLAKLASSHDTLIHHSGGH